MRYTEPDLIALLAHGAEDMYKEIQALQADNDRLREGLKPFAVFACSPTGECDCYNCKARDLLAQEVSE